MLPLKEPILGHAGLVDSSVIITKETRAKIEFEVTKIKICNIKHSEEIKTLSNYGVDIAGFRFFESDKLNQNIGFNLELIKEAASSGLMVSIVTTYQDLSELARDLDGSQIDFLQLHRSLSVEDIEFLRASFPGTSLIGLKTYEALLCGETDVLQSHTDFTVLDWAAGGTGRFPELDLFHCIDQSEAKNKLFVAGGLNHINVVRLLEQISPFGVDLDSGVRDPETRKICRFRTQRFVESVRSFEREPAGDILPSFSAVNKRPWSTMTSSQFDHSELVSKTRLLSIIEDTDKYNGAHASISQRIREALNDLQSHPDVKPEWLDAALVAFGSTLYFPTEMLKSTLRYLFLKLEDEISSTQENVENIIEQFHLFTNDPGALNEQFFRHNGIHGRLDQDKHARVGGVADLGSRVADLLHQLPMKIENARAELKMIFDRKVWVLIADQSLSGHSLEGDLDKLLWMLQIVESCDPQNRKIITLCQVMTNTAQRNLLNNSKIKQAIRDGQIKVDAAIYLGEEHCVLSPECGQTMNERTRQALLELCRWFAAEYIVEDSRYGRMLRKSGDDLEYGYRRAGLLISRQENCPTDSLPILWYEGTGKAGVGYRGPYPRVNSRIDDQKIERTGNQWDEIRQDERILSQLIALAKKGSIDE